MMQRYRLLLIMCICGLAGCTLRDPLEVSVSCPDAEYYMNANGDIQGHFDEPSDPFYSVYLETNFCPMAFPECYPKEDGALCHESCRENEVFCTDHCIKPQEDKTYCGAKGLCNDGDVNSDDYRGKSCRLDQKCEKGQCVCSRNTDIMCADNCIDPNDSDDFCGAKGLCNSSDVNSDDYKGLKCDKGQRCVNGQCICARESDVLCDGKCIDPDNNMTYCGAKGLCTDSELTSDNYKGVTCDKSKRCYEGQCVCARESDIECGGKCIDPLFDAKHCGAKGLCDESTVGLNYKGVTCASGQICEDGACRCVMSGYILCGDKCIDPMNNDLHCGARGLCTDSNYESNDFVGGNCMVTEDSNNRCVNRTCLCGANHHPYQNSCELDSKSNCGEHGNECKESNFANAESVACEHKECVVKTCQSGTFYAADGKSCITCQNLVRNVEVGDFISFGRYQQRKTVYGNRVKDPIEWQVLSVNDDSVLVISRFILDAVKYNETSSSVTWETCTLRAWLNGLEAYANDNFISAAFNEEESKCIQPVTNVNLNNQNYGTNGGNDTEDSVFLLSLCEAGHQPPSDQTQCPEDGPVYLASNADRKAYATDYAVEKGVYKPSGASNCTDVNGQQVCTSSWWLRSPGGNTYNAACVNFNSNIARAGYDVDDSDGLRPAMWLKRSNGE